MPQVEMVSKSLFVAAIAAAGGRLTISGRMVDLAPARRLVEIRHGNLDEVTYSVTEPEPDLEDGAYWVRHLRGEDWSPAERCEGEWFVPGVPGAVEQVAEIGPRIKPPAEEERPVPLIGPEAAEAFGRIAEARGEPPHAMRPLQRGVVCKCPRVCASPDDPHQHYCCQPAPALSSTALGAV